MTKPPKVSTVDLLLVLTNQVAIIQTLSIVMKTMAGNIEMSQKLDNLVKLTLDHVENRAVSFEEHLEK